MVRPFICFAMLFFFLRIDFWHVHLIKYLKSAHSCWLFNKMCLFWLFKIQSKAIRFQIPDSTSTFWNTCSLFTPPEFFPCFFWNSAHVLHISLLKISRTFPCCLCDFHLLYFGCTKYQSMPLYKFDDILRARARVCVCRRDWNRKFLENTKTHAINSFWLWKCINICGWNGFAPMHLCAFFVTAWKTQPNWAKYENGSIPNFKCRFSFLWPYSFVMWACSFDSDALKWKIDREDAVVSIAGVSHPLACLTVFLVPFILEHNC